MVIVVSSSKIDASQEENSLTRVETYTRCSRLYRCTRLRIVAWLLDDGVELRIGHIHQLRLVRLLSLAHNIQLRYNADLMVRLEFNQELPRTDHGHLCSNVQHFGMD